MPDYKDEPAGVEAMMPWSDFIKERCQGTIPAPPGCPGVLSVSGIRFMLTFIRMPPFLNNLFSVPRNQKSMLKIWQVLLKMPDRHTRKGVFADTAEAPAVPAVVPVVAHDEIFVIPHSYRKGAVLILGGTFRA